MFSLIAMTRNFFRIFWVYANTEYKLFESDKWFNSVVGARPRHRALLWLLVSNLDVMVAFSSVSFKLFPMCNYHRDACCCSCCRIARQDFHSGWGGVSVRLFEFSFPFFPAIHFHGKEIRRAVSILQSCFCFYSTRFFVIYWAWNRLPPWTHTKTNGLKLPNRILRRNFFQKMQCKLIKIAKEPTWLSTAPHSLSKLWTPNKLNNN